MNEENIPTPNERKKTYQYGFMNITYVSSDTRDAPTWTNGTVWIFYPM